MRTSLVAFTLALAGSSSASTFAGCYDPSVLSGVSASSNTISASDCATYCSTSVEANNTISLYLDDSCSCSSTTPLPTALLPSQGNSTAPTCSPDQVIGTYLSPSLEFASCSYASSTTAQYVSNPPSALSCFEACEGYPVTYIFPSAGGYNCYCAMSANGAGQASCGNNTFYAYSTSASRR